MPILTQFEISLGSVAAHFIAEEMRAGGKWAGMWPRAEPVLLPLAGFPHPVLNPHCGITSSAPSLDHWQDGHLSSMLPGTLGFLLGC